MIARRMHRPLALWLLVVTTLVGASGVPVLASTGSDPVEASAAQGAESRADAGVAQGAEGQADARVSGQADATVESPLQVASAEVLGGTRGAATTNGSGVFFAASANVVAGDDFTIRVGLNNRSSRAMLARLSVDAPAALDVHARPAGSQSAVRQAVPMEQGVWLLEVAPTTGAQEGESDGLDLVVSVPITAPPSQANLNFAIDPVDTGAGASPAPEVSSA